MPGIHDFLCIKTWMAGTSPAMTFKKRVASHRVIAGRDPAIHEAAKQTLTSS